VKQKFVASFERNPSFVASTSPPVQT